MLLFFLSFFFSLLSEKKKLSAGQLNVQNCEAHNSPCTVCTIIVSNYPTQYQMK